MRISTPFIHTVTSPRFGNSMPKWQAQGFPNEEEWTNFEKWIDDNNLNRYGDPQDSNYIGGNPLFYSRQSLYAYVTERHQDKPWNNK